MSPEAPIPRPVLPTSEPRSGWVMALLRVGGCVGLVGAVAGLDYLTGPGLSFALFYLLAALAAAWQGGFSLGILLAAVGAAAWLVVDRAEVPQVAADVALWNAAALFATMVLIASLVARLQSALWRERQLARTDPLTGVANGRTFYETAARETVRAHRAGTALTLAYLDVDDFKRLNDSLGHAVGDRALVQVVATVTSELRAGDVLGRLGGDEFALLLPETDAAGARTLLERLQRRVAEALTAAGWPVTLSVGAVTFPEPRDDVDRMIQRVDALMYAAKRAGKARLEHRVETAVQAPPVLLERRAVARLLCNSPARVRAADDGPTPTFATVRNLSAEGVAFLSEAPFEVGTLVIIEPLSPQARTLLARVVHTDLNSAGYLHGCRLPERLGADEVQAWLGAETAACGPA